MVEVKVAGIYIEKDNKALMVQEKGQSWGLWSIPMGHVDEGESPEEAIAREAKEETGYDVKIIQKLDPWTINGPDYKGGIEDNNKMIELNFFKGEVISGELKVNKKDLIDVKWIDKGKISDLSLRGNWLKPLFKQPLE